MVDDEAWRCKVAAVGVRIRHLLLALSDPVASHRQRCIAKRRARMQAETLRCAQESINNSYTSNDYMFPVRGLSVYLDHLVNDFD
jgi:hypothetical protein